MDIGILRQRARIAGESLLEVLFNVVGSNEIDLVLVLEMTVRRNGAESWGFPPLWSRANMGLYPMYTRRNEGFDPQKP